MLSSDTRPPSAPISKMSKMLSRSLSLFRPKLTSTPKCSSRRVSHQDSMFSKTESEILSSNSTQAINIEVKVADYIMVMEPMAKVSALQERIDEMNDKLQSEMDVLDRLSTMHTLGKPLSFKVELGLQYKQVEENISLLRHVLELHQTELDSTLVSMNSPPTELPLSENAKAAEGVEPCPASPSVIDDGRITSTAQSCSDEVLASVSEPHRELAANQSNDCVEEAHASMEQPDRPAQASPDGCSQSEASQPTGISEVISAREYQIKLQAVEDLQIRVQSLEAELKKSNEIAAALRVDKQTFLERICALNEQLEYLHSQRAQRLSQVSSLMLEGEPITSDQAPSCDSHTIQHSDSEARERVGEEDTRAQSTEEFPVHGDVSETLAHVRLCLEQERDARHKAEGEVATWAAKARQAQECLERKNEELATLATALDNVNKHNQHTQHSLRNQHTQPTVPPRHRERSEDKGEPCLGDANDSAQPANEKTATADLDAPLCSDERQSDSEGEKQRERERDGQSEKECRRMSSDELRVTSRVGGCHIGDCANGQEDLARSSQTGLDTPLPRVDLLAPDNTELKPIKSLPITSMSKAEDRDELGEKRTQARASEKSQPDQRVEWLELLLAQKERALRKAQAEMAHHKQNLAELNSHLMQAMEEKLDLALRLDQKECDSKELARLRAYQQPCQ